ncbi:MAG: hypothetical protein ACFCGT_03330 [Sandaracinaceae bacterium]
MSDALDPQDIPALLSDRRVLAEEERARAEAAKAEGDLPRAAAHAANLVMLFPNERGYLEVFDEIALAADDALALFPVAEGPIRVAPAAGRARALMMARRLPEALDLLAAVVREAPELPYLHWARRWLQKDIIPTVPFEQLFESVVHTALTIAVGVPVPPDEGDPRVVNLRAAADYFAALREHHPEESILWFGEALLRRRLSEPEETLRVAEAAVDHFPDDWRIRTALLNAYRDASRPEDALGEARTAMGLQPDDFSPLHDAAWAFVDAERPADAAPLFDELLRRDPAYPGAEACLHYTRWRATGSEEDKLALIRARERRWWDEQVRRFADEADRPVPYLTVLPIPDDPTAKIAQTLLLELEHLKVTCGLAEGLRLGIRSRFLDSPSVGVALRLGLAAMGTSEEADLRCDEVQSPDPRRDKAQVASPIWRFEGTTAVPVYGEANADVQGRVASLARETFRREVWDPAAKRLAEELGDDGYHPLLATLTHPPWPDPDFDALTWTWRCQVAAALILSHLGEWSSGYGRVALYSLVYGPSDWTTAAGLIAFTWRAMEGAAVREEAETVFRWMRTQVPERGFTAWEIVLAECWLLLGDHPDEVRRELDEWIDRYLATLPHKNTVMPPERRYGGVPLEAYGRFCTERDRLLREAQAGGQEVPTDDLEALGRRHGIEVRRADGALHPAIDLWEEALRTSPELHDRFLTVQRAASDRPDGAGDDAPRPEAPRPAGAVAAGGTAAAGGAPEREQAEAAREVQPSPDPAVAMATGNGQRPAEGDESREETPRGPAHAPPDPAEAATPATAAASGHATPASTTASTGREDAAPPAAAGGSSRPALAGLEGLRVPRPSSRPAPAPEPPEDEPASSATDEPASSATDEPDPEVFPGQPVPRLSDYVRILKRMQEGDTNEALAVYGLDMSSYGPVAQAWGDKLASDPALSARFTRLMNGA